MNRELITQLKNNPEHVIFGDMSQDIQQCLRDVGRENRECLEADYIRVWWARDKSDYLLYNNIYRIKPDYQPKPEYVDLPVVSDMQKWLGVKIPNRFPYPFVHLHCLPSLPYFVAFRTEHDKCVQLGDVATLLAGGHEVFARFRRDET